MPTPLKIPLDDGDSASALLQEAAPARALYVMAHGAGAGMAHPFLTAVSEGLAARGVATLRYQFPYMERKSKRPDPPRVAQAAVRAAVAEAARAAAGLPLFAGGKSFGGRMTSQAHAEDPLPGVRGLAFLGFPLHAPGRPSDERGAHLFGVQVPMLFLQGTRDEFADMAFLQPLVARLAPRSTLITFPQANHSFRVPKRSGHTDVDVLARLSEALAGWIGEVLTTGR